MLAANLTAVGAVALRHKFFIQNAFVGGVLVDQINAFRPFGDDVHGAHLPDYTQRRQLWVATAQKHMAWPFLGCFWCGR